MFVFVTMLNHRRWTKMEGGTYIYSYALLCFVKSVDIKGNCEVMADSVLVTTAVIKQIFV
jgi:hypothetical protein